MSPQQEPLSPQELAELLRLVSVAKFTQIVPGTWRTQVKEYTIEVSTTNGINYVPKIIIVGELLPALPPRRCSNEAEAQEYARQCFRNFVPNRRVPVQQAEAKQTL